LWRLIDIDDVPRSAPLKLQSPYGYFGFQLYKLLIGHKSKHGPEKKKITMNPYYNTKFLKYILTHIIPYAPLLDHSVLMHNDMVIVDDTNAPVESSFNVSALYDLFRGRNIAID